MNTRSENMATNTSGETTTTFGKTTVRGLAAVVIVAGMTSLAGAASVPYTNNFDGTGTNVDFDAGGNGGTEAFAGNVSTSGGWTVGGGGYTIDVKATPNAGGASNPATAALSIASVGSADWTMSTRFTVNSVTGTVFNNSGLTVGFGAFGSTNAFSTAGTNKYYLADVSFMNATAATKGTLRILELGSSPNVTIASNANAVADADLVNGATYTLKLTGTYGGTPGAGPMTMTLALYDATGTTQIGSSVSGVDNTPLAGTSFGYRNNYNENNKNFNITFDDFSVTNAAAVPEPAAVSVLAVAGVLAIRRRQWRRR